MIQTIERTIARLLSWALFVLVLAMTMATAALALAALILAGLVSLTQTAASGLWNFSKGQPHV